MKRNQMNIEKVMSWNLSTGLLMNLVEPFVVGVVISRGLVLANGDLILAGYKDFVRFCSTFSFRFSFYGYIYTLMFVYS
jgi:hypothetical protein